MDSLRAITHTIIAAALLFISPLAAAQTADTACLMPLPWGSSFEPDLDSLDCWTVVHECSIYPVTYGGYASEGAFSLAMTSTDEQHPCMIATPRLAHRADSLHVSFHLTFAAGSGTLQVGLMGSTFVPLTTISLANETPRLYEFYTDNFAAADTQAVAFRLLNGRVAIDEVMVEASTPCRRPCQAWVEEVYLYGISVGWDACGSTAMSYLVRSINTATNDTICLVADNSPFFIGGMTPGTTYSVDIAALCGGDTTGWFPVGLATTEVACTMPASAEVGALSATAVGLRWEYDFGGINTPTGMSVTIADQTNGGNTLTFNTQRNFLFADSLSTGHTYQAILHTVCNTDTSAPITLTFTPMNDACTEISGSTTSLVFPLAASSPYSYSQSLYPASLLAGIDSLYALAFNIVGGPILYSSRTVDVYVGQTTDSTLATNVSTMSAQLAANGVAFAPDEEGWAMLLFDHPIAVNQQRNLLITIIDRTGFSGGQLRFGTSYGTSGSSLYATSSEMPFDPAIPILSLTSSTAVPDIQLFGNCASSSCQHPAAMVIGQSATTLTVGWASSATPSFVNYCVAGSDSCGMAAVQGDSSVLQGLNPGTRYMIRVYVASCGYGPEFEGSTVCGTVSVPYHTDFSFGSNPCWQGTQTVYNGGVLLGGMLVSPEVGQNANTLQLRLSLAGFGRVKVGVCDADGENMQWVDSTEINNLVGDWMVYLDGYNGTSRRIAIAGSSYSSVLRAVTIEQLDNCLPPRNIVVTNVSGSGATLSWEGNAGLYEGYLFESGTGHSMQWSSNDNQITFSGLEGNTFYNGHIFRHCDDDFSMPVTFSFTTSCEAIEFFPYSESFESVSAPAQCWRLAYADQANEASNPMIHTTEHAYDGQRSFRFSSYNYLPSDVYDQYLISPRIVADDSIWVHFRYRKDNIEHEPFTVGFSTSGNSVGDFLWFSTEDAVVGEWRQYTVGLPASTRYIGIHYMGQNSYYLYIDDLEITGPGCEPPTITMVNEQADEVTLGWIAAGDTSYVAITDGIWLDNAEGVTVIGNEYTFSGLGSGHVYTVGVRSRCPDGRLSDWTTQEIFTVDTFCTPPTMLTVNGVEYTSAEISWQPTGWAQNWQVCLLSEGVLLGILEPVAVPFGMIVGLEQGRSYSVMVRSLCTDIPGPWGDTVTFTTPECYTVSNVTFERIDFRTISLSWDEAPVSTGRHRVEYGRQGFQRGTGTMVEAMGMPLTIGNLEPEPNYDFYIQNYCQPDVLSESVALVTVPSGLGIETADKAAWTLYPNPATSQITLSDIERGATVEVLDMAGRTVCSIVATDCIIPMDVSHLTGGTYFVRVTDNSSTTVGKFTVSR